MSARKITKFLTSLFLVIACFDAAAASTSKLIKIGVLSQFSQQEGDYYVQTLQREIRAALQQSGRKVELVNVAEFPMIKKSDNEQICKARFDLLIVIAEQALFQLLPLGPCVPTVFIAFTEMQQQERDSFFLPYRNWLTGFDTFIDLHEKRIDLLQIAYPHIKRVGVIFDKTDPTRRRLGHRLIIWAKTRGIDLVEIDLDLVGSQALVICCNLNAIYVPLSGSNSNEAKKIMEAVRKLKVPSIVEADDFLPFGATISYQVDRSEGMRRVANQIQMLSSGVLPSNIPIEGVHTVVMTVNTAASTILPIKINKKILSAANRVL